jgi:hypothetical protein
MTFPQLMKPRSNYEKQANDYATEEFAFKNVPNPSHVGAPLKVMDAQSFRSKSGSLASSRQSTVTQLIGP